MKINAIPTTSPVVNPNEGQAAGADRMARAKAIAGGQTLDAPQSTGDTQVDRIQNNVKKIRMKTQQSPDRHLRLEEPVAASEVVPQGDISASSEPAEAASEASKPLSPQFAALARQKRELQLMKQELDAQKQALATQPADTKSLEEYRSRIKANALSVLMEEGVTYDQLTEQILASNQENADLSQLRSEIKALKEGLESQNKSLSERDAQTERQALAQISSDAAQIVSTGDDFKLVREAGYTPKVVELIHRTFKKTGELLDTQEAARLVETELRQEAMRWAKHLGYSAQPSAPTAQTPQAPKQERPGTKIMRTLTNRDGVSSMSMNKRERAIAAMEGRLK